MRTRTIDRIVEDVFVRAGSDLTLSCYSVDRTSAQCCQSEMHENPAAKAGISHTDWLVDGNLVDTDGDSRSVLETFLKLFKIV